MRGQVRKPEIEIARIHNFNPALKSEDKSDVKKGIDESSHADDDK